MFKFFRKYNKIILGVGGSLLMVIFLLPQAGNMFQGDRGGMSRGYITVDGEMIKLTVDDIRTASAELGILRRLEGPNRELLVPMGGGDDEGLRWLLMVREAASHGLSGSDAHTNLKFQDWGIGPVQLGQVQADMRAAEPLIYQAMRHWQMVRQLQELVLDVRRVSRPQLRHFANDLQSLVSLNIVPIRAKDVIDPEQQVSEDDLKSQFERYKAQAAGMSQPYGFGYRLPNRVKIEYLAVPVERVAATITVSDVEAAQYYKANTDKFVPTPDEGEAPAADAPPAEPRDFEEVLPQIIETLRLTKARQRQVVIIKRLEALAAETERRLPKKDGFHVVAPDYVPVSFEQLAQQIQQQFGVLPDVVQLADKWLSMADLAKVEDFGGAAVRVGSGDNAGWLPVTAYVQTCREFNPQVNPLKLQEKIVANPVMDEAGTLYLFRVMDAQASRLPASIDEVREQVRQDVLTLRAYVKLVDEADTYVKLAATDGLEELAKSVGEKATVEEIPPFSRRQINRQRGGELVVPALPVVGRDGSFVDAAFALAQKADEKVDDVTTAPAADVTGSTPIDSQLTLYVMKVTEYKPITENDFEIFKMIQTQLGLIHKLDLEQVTSNPFSSDALKQRMQYNDPDAQPRNEPNPGEQTQS